MATPATPTESRPPLSPDRTPDGWGSVASAYDDVVTPFLAGYAQEAIRLTDLEAGERVLDVAAGAGALSLLAARRGARVLATDFSPAMIARLRRHVAEAGLDVETAVMDGQALDLQDASFDAAYSNFGVIFFPDQPRGFRELRRVLKPNGRAAVTAWASPEQVEWFGLFGAALKRVAPELPPPPAPPAALSLADPALLDRLMADAGFRDVHVTTVTREWRMPDADAVWRAFTETNPVFPSMMSRLGEDRVPALRDALADLLSAHRGPEGIALNGAAHVAVGHA